MDKTEDVTFICEAIFHELVVKGKETKVSHTSCDTFVI